MIFYIYYRRWLGLALICISAFVCSTLLDKAIMERSYIPFDPSGGHYIEVDRLTLWTAIFFWSVTSGVAGYLGNKGKLKDRGVITEDEFEQKKKQLLNI